MTFDRSATLEHGRHQGEGVWLLLCRSALRGIGWAARVVASDDTEDRLDRADTLLKLSGVASVDFSGHRRPALAVDWILRRSKGARSWTLALALGAAFVAVMLAVHWPFGSFLLSPWSRNWFFATHEFPYFISSTSASFRHQFHAWDASPGALWRGLLLAVPVAALSARLGLAWGGWMSRVRR